MMLPSQSWMLKPPHFSKKHQTATPRRRVRGTCLKCVRLVLCRKQGILFQVICSLAFSGAEEESLSTDEDVPFRDDLNDQSYDPKGER